MNDPNKRPRLGTASTMLCVIGGTLLLGACLDEGHFGLHSEKQIVAFELESQSGAVTIDQQQLRIDVPISTEADITRLAPTTLTVSSLATVSPKAGEAQDFTDPVTYTVTAEDGSTAEYLVTAVRQTERVQLPNSGFDEWFDVSGNRPYQQPGTDAESTIWATGNDGVVTLVDANTNPEDLGQGDLSARLETIQLPALPLTPHIAAGSLFTGIFKVNISDPAASAQFGRPFTAQPSGFKVQYRYKRGDQLLDSDRKPIDDTDKCDIYVLLEHRSGETIERVATGWFRSDAEATEWTQLEVSITYGELDASAPDYMKPPQGQSYAAQGTKPTHISVVFSSSFGGDLFIGAYGSLLELNDFELVYP